jgi:hypothetical protein
MDVAGFIFGRHPLPVLTAAPANAKWVKVRSRESAPAVHAELAARDGVLKARRAKMPYRAGQHYIVTYAPGDQSVVRKDLFERTYTSCGDARYIKNPKLIFRYFVLARDAVIVTLEGNERADAGDWIVEGVAGELHPVSPARGAQLYAPV